MILGGTIVGPYHSMEEFERLLVQSRFKAITAPFNCRTDPAMIDAYMKILSKHNVSIAEVGVWNNPLDPDKAAAADAIAYAKEQLKLADRLHIPCCVNIAGTPGTAGWDAADESNFTEKTYRKTIETVREIIDDAQPSHAYYCLEPMPWMIPDGPDEYLSLIHDVNRPMFGAHMDFINMINCPRRYLQPYVFIRDCFSKLAPYIKSTHIKDTRMNPRKLTTMLEECSPGEGCLDFERVLTIIDRLMPENAPVLLEHMQTDAEYRTAYACIAAKAEAAGISY